MVLSGNPVAWNVGCVLYIFWVGGQCLIQFVDLIVWRDNAINVAPVWCDISEYLSILFNNYFSALC